MSTFTKIEEIEAWVESRKLTKEIYHFTKQNSFRKDFGLCDQIRKASVSIMSNIAEGFERSKATEFAYFLRVAKGSAGEVRAQLYVALDQKYISEQIFEKLYNSASAIGKMINGLISYLSSNRKK